MDVRDQVLLPFGAALAPLDDRILTIIATSRETRRSNAIISQRDNKCAFDSVIPIFRSFLIEAIAYRMR